MVTEWTVVCWGIEMKQQKQQHRPNCLKSLSRNLHLKESIVSQAKIHMFVGINQLVLAKTNISIKMLTAQTNLISRQTAEMIKRRVTTGGILSHQSRGVRLNQCILQSCRKKLIYLNFKICFNLAVAVN